MIESFFSAFRSLQDKTQVIPLSKRFCAYKINASLEVSVVGVLWAVWLEKNHRKIPLFRRARLSHE
jgi:dGTP triphosphohydrolase